MVVRHLRPPPGRSDVLPKSDCCDTSPGYVAGGYTSKLVADHPFSRQVPPCTLAPTVHESS
jgi:hypothetical protein